MKCTPAKNVDAPVIEGYPMVLEFKVTNISDQDIDGFRVFGKIVNVMADESVLTDGKPDLHKMDLIYYDPITLDYLTIGKTAGKSFSIGKKFMD
jgi:flavin reductase (DIM6/NTAB) family NADH-FMN oxidoreductase RutF